MTYLVNINESRPTYAFLDKHCIGRTCFHPVDQGSAGKGCWNRKLNGCPTTLPPFGKERATARRQSGWRNATAAEKR